MLLTQLEQLLGEDGRHFAATLLHDSKHLEPDALAVLIEQKDRYEALWQKALKNLKRAGWIDDDTHHSSGRCAMKPRGAGYFPIRPLDRLRKRWTD